jgi:Na+-translocating ferredoxin:NAD+ oxidoreductase subunit B
MEIQNRRKFIGSIIRGALFGGLAVLTGDLIFNKEGTLYGKKRRSGPTVWQLDPFICIQCGRCATNCVKTPSAVKCTHAFAMCGYCNLCSGFFKPGITTLDTGAEKQLCPVGAIKRTFIEDPFYEYIIDEALCIGCGKCVKGCGAFGNGSLQLQVRHHLCDNCNDCSIARNCPSGAFGRVPLTDPYLLKGFEKERL